jgi:hypothetical protein
MAPAVSGLVECLMISISNQTGGFERVREFLDTETAVDDDESGDNSISVWFVYPRFFPDTFSRGLHQ